MLKSTQRVDSVDCPSGGCWFRCDLRRWGIVENGGRVCCKWSAEAVDDGEWMRRDYLAEARESGRMEPESGPQKDLCESSALGKTRSLWH
jgi:hypothetical protein